MTDYDRVKSACAHLERSIKVADLSTWPDMARATLTADERLTVAATAMQSVEDQDAKELLAHLSARHVPETPGLVGPMEVARDWVRYASAAEMEAFAATIFEAMPANDRRKFIGWANSKMSVEAVAAE